MPTFRQGDVVRVPFPYTDRDRRQYRPALVVASIAREGEGGSLLWVVMITSAENRAWPDDHPISAFGEVGLPIPSVVRPAKITTVEASDAERIGHLDAPFMQRVLRTVEAFLKPPS